MEFRARKALAKDDELLERLRTLTHDTVAEEYLPVDETVDHEVIERQKAEDSFQHALARRTWWRLKPPERACIRAAVLREHPSYRTHPGSSLEFECLFVVEQLLAEARKRKGR